MLFSSRLPLWALVDHCRGVRHMLDAGLTLGQAMKQQSKKGPLPIRPVAARMASKLLKGTDFKTVLGEEREYFPPLFLALGSVAEQTGNMPELLRELEEYFEMQRQMIRQFWGSMAGPLFRLVIAIIVLTLFIWLLGVVESIVGPNPFSVLGLKGESGAIIFLAFWIFLFVFLFGGYFFVRNVLKRGALVDGVLLQIPVIGGTMRNFALSRFSRGLALSMEAGIPIKEAARLSLEATSNHAFTARIERVEQSIDAGVSLTEALRETSMFPEHYLSSVETAEIGGREPEVMLKQAKNLHEDGVRGMKRITSIAGWGVWILVGGFIIWMFFSILMQVVGYREGIMKDLGY